jgi:hypothetical protein
MGLHGFSRIVGLPSQEKPCSQPKDMEHVQGGGYSSRDHRRHNVLVLVQLAKKITPPLSFCGCQASRAGTKPGTLAMRFHDNVID